MLLLPQNLGGLLSGSVPVPVAGPATFPHWSKVALLSEYNGENGHNQFYDESSRAHAVTTSGTVNIQGNKASFDGSTAYIGYPDHADLNPGAEDFTLEVFGVVFDTVSGRRGICNKWNATGNQKGYAFEFRGDASPDDLAFLYSLNGSAVLFWATDGWTPTVGVAYTVAAERSGSTGRIYIDGVMRGKKTDFTGTIHSSTERFEVGRGGHGTNDRLGGDVGGVRFTKAALYDSDSGYTVPTLPLPKSPAADVRLHSFNAGSRVETFLDQANIDASSGVLFSCEKPTKYAGNPLLPVSGANADTWDRDKVYVSALHNSGAYQFWYGNLKEPTWDYEGSSYATSSDGLNLEKPNLGLITYGGNTNNNIFDAKYDPSVVKDGSTFVHMFGADASGNSNNQALFYTSSDGYSTGSLQKTITHGSYAEFHGLVQRADGRWLAYYTYNHISNQRHIGAYLSNTSDITGTWVDQGQILAAPSSARQFYQLGASLIDGVLYGLAGRYNSTDGAIWVDLYTSLNGVNWTRRRPRWMVNGPETYDPAMIFGKTLIDNGTEIRFYYGGSVDYHDETPPRDMRICLAQLNSRRLGIVYTLSSGTITTTALTATAPLTVNAEAAGDKLSVELLDPSDDSVLTGFAAADCDNLDGNAFAKRVTWGGLDIPTDQSVKIKFYLAA